MVIIVDMNDKAAKETGEDIELKQHHQTIQQQGSNGDCTSDNGENSFL